MSDYLLPVYGVQDDLYPYNAIFKKAHKADVFYDKDFPGSEQSIQSFPKQLRKQIGAYDWKKPWEYMDSMQKQIQVFEDKIEPNDIKQGELGDCYFLSVLSAIADSDPYLIQRLFVTQEYQGLGLYCVFLNIMGHWRQVCIDDRVPCFTDGGPIFSQSHGNELWVVLMEKAYAKSYGSYGNIETGLPGQAFRDVTGAPADYLIPETGQKSLKVDEAWYFIEKALGLKYILTASSEKSIYDDEYQNDSGIISEHCYAILDAQQVNEKDGYSDRIIKLRNPWGHKEWSGEWGDNSDKWTEELKSQLKVENKDDGIFWISIQDFVQQFKSICVCKIHPKYLYSSYQIKSGHQQEQITKRTLLMNVYKDTHGFVTVSQKDNRHYRNKKQMKYGLVRIIIGGIDVKQNKIISFTSDKLETSRDVYVEGKFTQGTYIIYVEIEWYNQEPRDIVISSYSQSSVQLVEVDVQDNLSNQILDSLLLVNQSQNNQIKNYGDDISRVSGSAAGYLFFIYKNNSIASKLIENVQMQDLDCIVICPPQTQDEEFRVELKPSSQKIIKYRVTKEKEGSFQYSNRAQYTISQSFTRFQLIEMCKKKPEKIVQRKVKGEPIEVYFSIFNHQLGTCFLYQNKTNKTFNEDLNLKLKNLQIEYPTDAPHPDLEPLRLTVPPGGEYFVSIKSIDQSQPTSYSMNMQFLLK